MSYIPLVAYSTKRTYDFSFRKSSLNYFLDEFLEDFWVILGERRE